jgi:tRNA 5-methylaminomethyl-2-thiouridine biosynthesis bifunctional protein
VFDVAIIGGGIAGCCAAYFAKQAGLSVVLYEKEAIASGASGAAGAFIAPRIGKGSPLQTLTNEAFLFATDFYAQNFPEFFTQSGIYRVAKNPQDAQEFDDYAKTLHLAFVQKTYRSEKALFFPQGGTVEAKKTANALLKGVEVIYKKTTLDTVRAKHIILATGADAQLCDLEYIGLQKTWGLRIDATCHKPLQSAVHKNISVSSTKEGRVKIGATHERAPFDTNVACKEGIDFLLRQAHKITDANFEYSSCICGTRSAVRDFFPMCGHVIDVEQTLESYPSVIHGMRPKKGLIYRENLYMIGGTGGRGFVFSPYLANKLIDLITDQKEVPKSVNPDRLFYKWARKLNKKTD